MSSYITIIHPGQVVICTKVCNLSFFLLLIVSNKHTKTEGNKGEMWIKNHNNIYKIHNQMKNTITEIKWQMRDSYSDNNLYGRLRKTRLPNISHNRTNSLQIHSSSFSTTPLLLVSPTRHLQGRQCPFLSHTQNHTRSLSLSPPQAH